MFLNVLRARVRRPSVWAFAVALVLAGACGTEPAAPPVQTVPAVPPPSGPRVYVTDEPGGFVIALDVATGAVVERIQVGKRPRGIRLSRDGKQLYVALSGSPINPPGSDESKLPPPDRSADGIGIVDLATHKLLKVIPGGQDPESFDLSLDGGRIFVSNEETSEMSVIDLAKGEVVHRVKIGEEPEGVTVRPDGKVVYVTCEGDNSVHVIDTTTYKMLGRVPTGARPRSIVFTADSATAFVTGENSENVTVIDAMAHKPVATVKITAAPPKQDPPLPAPLPMGLAIAPDGSRVYVSNGRAASVSVIDVATRKLVATYEGIGQRVWGIDISADGRKLFTANGRSGDVSIVDTATGKVEQKVTTGGSPWGVAVGR